MYPLSTFVIPSSGKHIDIRQFTCGEEKILLYAKESYQQDEDKADVMRAIRQVCQACTTTDISNFIESDLTMLLVKLRVFSIHPIITAAYIDSDDNETRQFDVDIDKLKVNFPKASRTLRIKYDPVTIELQYPIASPQYQLKDFIKKILVHHESGSESRYDFVKQSSIEQDQFIDDLPLMARKKLEEFAAAQPYVGHIVSYQNNQGANRNIEIKGLYEIFTLMMANRTLSNYFDVTYRLVQKHKWSLIECESLSPFERDYYIKMISKENSGLR